MTPPEHRDVVLLTGASGCLGFHTLRLLIEKDDLCGEIRCLDLLPPEESMRKIIDKELEQYNNLASENSKKCIRYFEGDVRDVNIVEQVTDGVNCIIHCAAKIDVWTENSDQDETELESVNVGGTENLLKAATRFGVHKFIHVSSFEAYMGYYTIYYATETTMPETDYLIFGPSGKTKKLAEEKVKRYSNNKLARVKVEGRDSLNAIVVRFPVFYGEYERYFINKVLEVTKFFGGRLQRWTNIWIRQQPIYVGNAAWALIKAKQRMNIDQSISGEDFHITDDTQICDLFDFVEPYLEIKGMRVTKRGFNFFLVWLLMILFFAMKRYCAFFDFFGLFSRRNSRLNAAIEQDKLRLNPQLKSSMARKAQPKHWFQVITPQTFGFMCTSNFLNRTKASLRLDFEPLIDPDESQKLTQDWYKEHVEL